jgi:hypothetical protein
MEIRTLADVEVAVNALYARDDQLAARVRHVEKQLDTLGTPWWKRLWFRIDGWPPWWIVGPRRRRFWHRAP